MKASKKATKSAKPVKSAKATKSDFAKLSQSKQDAIRECAAIRAWVKIYRSRKQSALATAQQKKLVAFCRQHKLAA